MTGLSMNPDYSVTEKRDFINWYKDYFAKFTSEELQALPSQNIPNLDQIKSSEKV